MVHKNKSLLQRSLKKGLSISLILLLAVLNNVTTIQASETSETPDWLKKYDNSVSENKKSDSEEVVAEDKKEISDSKEVATESKEETPDDKEVATEGEKEASDDKEVATESKEETPDDKEVATEGEKEASDDKEVATESEKETSDDKEVATESETETKVKKEETAQKIDVEREPEVDDSSTDDGMTMLYAGGGAAAAVILIAAIASGSSSSDDSSSTVSTPTVAPVGADIHGSNWNGTLNILDSRNRGYQAVSASINQNGRSVSITTSSTLNYGRAFNGTINSSGFMLMYDSTTGEDWTTFRGNARWNSIGLYDYVNNYRDLDKLALSRSSR